MSHERMFYKHKQLYDTSEDMCQWVIFLYNHMSHELIIQSHVSAVQLVRACVPMSHELVLLCNHMSHELLLYTHMSHEQLYNSREDVRQWVTD